MRTHKDLCGDSNVQWTSKETDVGFPFTVINTLGLQHFEREFKELGGRYEDPADGARAEEAPSRDR